MEPKSLANFTIAQQKEDPLFPTNEMCKTEKYHQQAIINCQCLQKVTNEALIQCELCQRWQHSTCSAGNQQNQVPANYICFICRNTSKKQDYSNYDYIDDQEWFYNGKLPVANFHAKNPALEERFNILKKTHVLIGNLLELKKCIHSLEVKINIANTKDHPKLYLWEKDWETIQSNISCDNDEKWMKQDMKSDEKNINYTLSDNKSKYPENIEPKTLIDSNTCQLRLLKHIKNQQVNLGTCLNNIEEQILEIESFEPPKSSNSPKTQEILQLMLKDLETMKNLGKLNTSKFQSSTTTL